MANFRFFQRSFAGGEVTPELFGRIDDVKYATGTALCRNFIPKPHGPVSNRPGFKFVREVKDSSKKVRLIPFTFSVTQTMIIEVGHEYFRFHTQGGTLLHGGTPYELAHPYQEQDLFDIHYVQSADVLTLVHPNYPPKELRRLGATHWELMDISFSSTLDEPTGVTLTKVSNENKYDYWYVVTAIDNDGLIESSPSTPASITGNLFETGAKVTINWTAVTGASRYNIYKMQGGIYGYIGSTETTTLVDDNIAPDLSKAPPKYDDVFNQVGNYPGAVSYFEQRRCFAGTTNQPQNIWMTKSGTESNMSYSLPIKDDDRIAFRVAAREANTIRHIVPLTQLVLLTSSAEWRVTSVNSDAITPTSISVSPQSYVGANNVQPVIVNNTLIYAAARGGHIREFGYNWQSSGYVSGDLSLRSPHLFDGYQIVDMAYGQAPQQIVWFVSSNGRLLGLTYIPEQQIGAWHWHDTEGAFESCAVVTENNEDVLYCVIQREVNGQQVRYIEQLSPFLFGEQQHAFFVDSGLMYSGLPVNEISGLNHLEGKTVNVLLDGAVHPQRQVINGQIRLDVEGSVIVAGLPITSDLQTLPIAAQIDNAFGQGRVKNINKAWLRVHQSSGIWVGPDATRLREYKQRTSEPFGVATSLKTGDVDVLTTPSWTDGGQVFVRQIDPLPLTIVSLTAEVSTGG